MRLENFKAEDYYKLDREEGFEVWMQEKDIPKSLLILEDNSVARSVWFGNKLYAVFGIIETRCGVAEVFFMPSKGWVTKKKSICCAVKKDLDVVVKMFNRVQMTCLEKEVFLRFSEFFGFVKEGSLKHYDRLGRTYTMLAITGGIV